MDRWLLRAMAVLATLALSTAPLARADDEASDAPGIQALEQTAEAPADTELPGESSQRVVWPWVVGGAAAGTALGFLLAFLLRPEPPPGGTLGVIDLGGAP